MSLNKRLMKLWFRNMAVAFGIIFGVFASGFMILYLNTYFGTQLFTLGLLAAFTIAFPVFICYKIAQEQYQREQIRSKRLMETLKREFN